MHGPPLPLGQESTNGRRFGGVALEQYLLHRVLGQSLEEPKSDRIATQGNCMTEVQGKLKRLYTP